jgi:hypothetical protein
VILYLTLGSCALVAALLVYRYDLYDREPVALPATAVLLGAGGMALAGRLETATFTRLPGGAVPLLALIASSLEEALKLVAVALLALLFRRVFNDPMDGIIYGSMAPGTAIRRGGRSTAPRRAPGGSADGRGPAALRPAGRRRLAVVAGGVLPGHTATLWRWPWSAR